jgi:hypothetical protein
VVVDAAKLCYHLKMHSRHRKTLEAIFATPVPATLEWRKIENLFLALGAFFMDESPALPIL